MRKRQPTLKSLERVGHEKNNSPAARSELPYPYKGRCQLRSSPGGKVTSSSRRRRPASRAGREKNGGVRVSATSMAGSINPKNQKTLGLSVRTDGKKAAATRGTVPWYLETIADYVRDVTAEVQEGSQHRKRPATTEMSTTGPPAENVICGWILTAGCHQLFIIS